MSALKEQLCIIDEAYLTGIANKGIVNRAQKDLAASGIRFTLGDTVLKATFADGTSVTITNTLGNYKCSCPSRTICKHVVMALIIAAGSMDADREKTTAPSGSMDAGGEQPTATPSGSMDTDREKTGAAFSSMDAGGEHSTAAPSGNMDTGEQQLTAVPSDSMDTGKGQAAITADRFGYLLEYKQDTLVKEYGKSVYNDVLFKVISGATCVIEESSILILKIMDGAFTVRFLPGVPVSESVCSCKIKNCRHRLEAIMQYIKHKTGKLTFEPVVTESDVNIAIIPHVSEFVEAIFRTGLIRLPAEYAEKCAQFAVLCHGAGFAVFERLFETCSRELTLYEQKSARFNRNMLIRNLTRIYQICNEIREGGAEAAVKLAGQFKRQYMELPKLRVMGLGAYPWYAKSGFCGVTALFYAPDLHQTLTFTSTRPVDSEQEAARGIMQIWRAKTAWNLPVSIGAISKAELSLVSAKISDNGRLSSSGNTSASLLKSVTSLEPETREPEALEPSEPSEPNEPKVRKPEVFEKREPEDKGVVFDDFSNIKRLFSSDTDSTRMVYAVLVISALGKGVFNKVTQTYSIQLTDKYENKLPLTLRYSKINETAMLNFEYMERKSMVPEAITVSISLPEDDFQADIFPVAIRLKGEMINVGEDKLFTINEKSEFTKFFGI